MQDKVKNIGLLGGSFNPPHVGHVEMCRYLLDRGDCDQVWVVPCYQHPFNKILAPFDDRLAMCRFTFQGFRDSVWITDLERRLGGVSHTVRTVQNLKYRYPDNHFALIVGGDIAKESAGWKDFDLIREMVSFIEIPRGKDSFITNISSSEIRRRIRAGEDYTLCVVKPVAVYIVTHGLYHT